MISSMDRTSSIAQFDSSLLPEDDMRLRYGKIRCDIVYESKP